MAVSLQKGGNTSLTKEAGGSLSSVVVGLGWDAQSRSGHEFDLDASAFVVDDTGNVLSEKWFIFYANKVSPDNSVVHQGDNLTGAGDGDDEQIEINLSTLPPTAEKIVVAVTIHEAQARGQNFGQVKNAFVRIVDSSTGTELARFDLGEDFSLETAVVFGEVYRNGSDWKLRAIGAGYNNGLAGLCADHGVQVG